MTFDIACHAYAEIFGLATSDHLYPTDTDLIAKVGRGLTLYGKEVRFSGGEVAHDGMGQSQCESKDCADTAITSALIIDH